jgi:predicted small integral membrane protein
MSRRSLSYNWTEEDRLVWVRWRRHMAVFYGCAALLIFGIIVLTKASSPTPDKATSLQTARGSADLSGRAQ